MYEWILSLVQQYSSYNVYTYYIRSLPIKIYKDIRREPENTQGRAYDCTLLLDLWWSQSLSSISLLYLFGSGTYVVICLIMWSKDSKNAPHINILTTGTSWIGNLLRDNKWYSLYLVIIYYISYKYYRINDVQRYTFILSR